MQEVNFELKMLQISLKSFALNNICSSKNNHGYRFLYKTKATSTILVTKKISKQYHKPLNNFILVTLHDYDTK